MVTECWAAGTIPDRWRCTNNRNELAISPKLRSLQDVPNTHQGPPEIHREPSNQGMT